MGGKKQKKEKRANPRVKERFPVRIISGGKTYRGMSCDISLGGIACKSPVSLPVSTSVRVDLILPGSHTSPSQREVVCRAKVVRREQPGESGVKDYRLALGFNKISKKAQQGLADFIWRKLSSRPGQEVGIMTEPADISTNGISCKSDSFIPPFHEVQINVIIPFGDHPRPRKTTIQCSGVVVSCEKEKSGGRYDVSLYFTEIKRSDRKFLRDYLSYPAAGKS